MDPRRWPMKDVIFSHHMDVYLSWQHLAAEQYRSFPACVRWSQGSRAFDLFPGTALRCCHVEEPESNIRALPSYLHSCEHVNKPGVQTCTYAHYVMQVLCIVNKQTHTYCKLTLSQMQAWSKMLCPQVSRSCSANTTFLPLDLSVWVPLNLIYIPSVHPAPVGAPLCSPALNFCQEIH